MDRFQSTDFIYFAMTIFSKASWYEHLLIEDPATLVSENITHHQRQLIGDSLGLINKLKYLVSAARTIKLTKDDDVKHLHDQLHCILRHCINIRNSIAALVTENRMQNGTCRLSESTATRVKADKVQFAAKAVQVGVAILSQNLNELCFPAGRYSICLEGYENDASPNRTVISPYFMQHNEDWWSEEN